ncbi:hypothetical protein CC86DRAFT_39683 [Ophiobolus disseminans]|uniref:FAD-binding PCMH-type domain-containing protein n=1 Tax=Ophiobolus disseminans TaxID=1469910 RepID=A0A6A6ZVX6_9PLEO|nr:hypothetical protein CC86DRAFT_39683 [Ophiobolus disseminans]
MRRVSALASTLYLALSLVSAERGSCKCTPESSCWPSDTEWSAFNQTLSSSLIRGVPPGSVCYPNQPNYNPEACEFVRSQWFNSSWHAEDPVSIDYPIWTNNSCNPVWPNGTSITGDSNAGAKGCSIGAYPAYVVNASTPEQIGEAFTWARERNIRIIVKNTGHSYPGRSVGYGSLSIWTHHLHVIEYIEDFRPTACEMKSSTSAARLAAGSTGGEVLARLAKYKAVAVTGANPDVGVVGWLTGGGHGPLSQTYGMGADNLLEATIVTPDGKVLITNPCQSSDIFFAIRGGGGGTYGVVTEVVVKTFPTPKTTSHVFKMMSLNSNSSSDFYDFLGFLHSEMQRLKEGGMQGYYFIVGPPYTPQLSLAWTFTLFNKPNGTVEALLEPIETYLKERAQSFAYMQNITHADTYFDISGSATNEAVASGGSAYTSRLLSPQSLSDGNATSKVFAEIGPRSSAAESPMAPLPNPIIIGHMIASPDTPAYYPDVISMNPAWRNTLVHLIVVQTWPDGLHPELIDSIYKHLTYATNEALRNLSPNTGAYFNEADSYEPDWQTSFFGSNYERLKSVKEKYDPDNVLWCRRCVGSEALVEQPDGRLCLKAPGWTAYEGRGYEGVGSIPRRPGWDGYGTGHTEL